MYCVVGALALGLSGGCAEALDIGRALSISPRVSGAVPGRTADLSSGDSVVADESISTAAAGEAHLRFLDATDLAIGPSSTVKLDRFVFDPSGKAKNFVLDATKGVFRFITGTSVHEAYQILTPAAVIGVRGTRFSFIVAGNRLNLTVNEGSVVVCPRDLGPASCLVVEAGESVMATPDRPVTLFTPPPLAVPPPQQPGNLPTPGGFGPPGIRLPRDGTPPLLGPPVRRHGANHTGRPHGLRSRRTGHPWLERRR